MNLDNLHKEIRETTRLGNEAYTRLAKQLGNHRGKFVTMNVHTDEYVITDTADAGQDAYFNEFGVTFDEEEVHLFTMEITGPLN